MEYKYNRKVLRKLLKALTDSELAESLDDFPAVRGEFTTGQKQNQRWEIILNYFEQRQELFNQFLEAIKDVNSVAYKDAVLKLEQNLRLLREKNEGVQEINTAIPSIHNKQQFRDDLDSKDVLEMEQVIDDFFGVDVIASNNALHHLIARGEESLDLVISQFNKRSLSKQLEIQLANFFCHFGNVSLPKLIEVFKEGNWSAMQMASPCFSKLPYEPAGSQLIEIVYSGKIDKERLAIEAIGYLGNPNWSFKLKNKVTDNDGYGWDKLSFYLFATFFRIATKAKTHNEVSSSLFYIEAFYNLAGSEKFRKLWDRNWYSMEIIFSDFEPIAGDAIMSDWLKSKEPFFRVLGLKALGWMRLSRATKTIGHMALSGKESEEVILECAHSLSMIDSSESANALKVIFETTPKTNDLCNKISLFLAMALGRLSDRGFIEKIYPELMLQGGETEAHTLYNLGILGFEESIWIEGISSENYIVRASVAPVYARRRGSAAIPKLLQMERETSHEIEKTLILSALIIAGHTPKKEEFLSAVYAQHQSNCLVMLRITWKREIVFALGLAEATHLEIWESMSGLEMSQVLQDISELENSFKKPGRKNR